MFFSNLFTLHKTTKETTCSIITITDFGITFFHLNIFVDWSSDLMVKVSAYQLNDREFNTCMSHAYVSPHSTSTG